MYPYGKSLFKPYITWVFMGYFIPKNPKVEHNHGYTVWGTPNCPLNKSCKTLALDSPYRPVFGKTIVGVFFFTCRIGLPSSIFCFDTTKNIMIIALLTVMVIVMIVMMEMIETMMLNMIMVMIVMMVMIETLMMILMMMMMMMRTTMTIDIFHLVMFADNSPVKLLHPSEFMKISNIFQKWWIILSKAPKRVLFQVIFKKELPGCLKKSLRIQIMRMDQQHCKKANANHGISPYISHNFLEIPAPNHTITHRIHVWHIYLHEWLSFWAKCR